MRSTKFALPAIGVVALLALTGCVDNSTDNPDVSGDIVEVTVDKAAEAMLPDSIRDAGKIVVGIDPYYAPNEYKDDAGAPIGWAIELGDAIATKLGVTMEYKASAFDKIVPSVNGGTYDIGYSSFTDNLEREEKVDFVNYYNAGIQWAQQIGKDVDPANACGLSVSVQRTTYEETKELPAKSDACVADGKEPISIQPYETQDEATNALALGKVDAMSADSPITQYAVSKVGDKIELAGDAFDVAPYGIAVDKKKTELRDAIQAALQSLVDDGGYMEILERWGVESGGISEITINAASKQ